MIVNVSGFYDEASGKIDEQIALAKKLGGKFICPRNIDGKNIAEFSAEEFIRDVKPRLDAANIGFSSIGSPIGKVGIDDEIGFDKQKIQLAELVKIAQAMNCKYIRVFSFFYGDKKPEDCTDKVIARLRELLAIAKDSGVSLMHENEKKVFGDVPQRVLTIYNALKDEGLKLCFDASNYIQCDVNPKEAFDMLKDYVEYYHIKDCSEYKVEVPLGTGKGEYEYIFAQLKQRGYQGFMTLEPHTFKYAILKPLIYLVPFAPLFAKNYFKAFRMVDKKLGKGYLSFASRKEMFELQYNTLLKMIGEEN